MSDPTSSPLTAGATRLSSTSRVSVDTTAEMPRPKPGAGLPCPTYLPQLDEDGHNWKVWCCGVRNHEGHHRLVNGLQFEADALDEG